MSYPLYYVDGITPMPGFYVNDSMTAIISPASTTTPQEAKASPQSGTRSIYVNGVKRLVTPGIGFTYIKQGNGYIYTIPAYVEGSPLGILAGPLSDVKAVIDGVKNAIQLPNTKTSPFTVNINGISLKGITIKWWLVAAITIGGIIVFNGLTRKREN